MIDTLVVFLLAYAMLGSVFTGYILAGRPRVQWSRVLVTLIAWPFLLSWFWFDEYRQRRRVSHLNRYRF